MPKETSTTRKRKLDIVDVGAPRQEKKRERDGERRKERDKGSQKAEMKSRKQAATTFIHEWGLHGSQHVAHPPGCAPTATVLTEFFMTKE